MQASSIHFRYHASSPDLVAAGILDGLEANRSEMYSFFGLQGDDVILEVDPSGLVGTGLASFIGKLVFQ